MTKSFWISVPLSILATLALTNPALAQSSQEDSSENNSSLAGECRQTNRRLDVFAQPSVSSDSRSLSTLAPDTQVTLTGEIEGGWVQINRPARGFVIARHLKNCTRQEQESQTTQTNQNTTDENRPAGSIAALNNLEKGACRRAITDLAVRSRPDTESNGVGTVREGATATVTGKTSEGDEDRLWVEISAPASGWISGGRAGGSNLVMCE